MRRYDRIKSGVHEVLENKVDNRTGQIFAIFLTALILLNVLAVILETVAGLYSRYTGIFRYFEIFSVAVFAAEYLLRVWSCTSEPKYSHPVAGRLRFAVTPMALVDLIAILPFFLPFAGRMDLRFIRVLRLSRFARILKMGRFSDAMSILGKSIRDKKEELLICLFTVLLLLVLSSSAMYLAENQAQPEKFASIPDAMWWGITTLATVGYGDIVPVTPAGKVIGGLVAFLGIAMFALPAGIISSAFTQEIRRQHAKKRRCPHCGKEID